MRQAGEGLEVTTGPENGGRRRPGRLASGGAIREAAAALFLEKGYQGTSMDEIASAAQVSKQTIYTHFASKEELFADLVLGNADRVEEFAGGLAPMIDEATDLEAGLRRLARRYIALVVRPDVLRLRRLVIGESARFPELARTYYERVPGRVLDTLAGMFARLAAEGRLEVQDPALAAQHFAWLIVGEPVDRGMFYPAESLRGQGELEQMADAAVKVFLAAYGPKGAD